MTITRLKVLRWSIMSGAVYFFLVSLAHAFSFKFPGLFIYFDVPSHRYQDGIISFLCFGWSAFFYTASMELPPRRPATKAVILAGGIAIVGLSLINAMTNFQLISPRSRVVTFWLEMIIGLLYWVWLALLMYLTRDQA
jgi:hypothetical protein